MSNISSRRGFLGAAGAVGIAASLPITMAHAQGGRSAAAAAGYVQPTGERSLTIGSLEDLEAQAAKVFPADAFAYIASGADRQITLRENARRWTPSACCRNTWSASPRPT